MFFKGQGGEVFYFESMDEYLRFGKPKGLVEMDENEVSVHISENSGNATEDLVQD